MTHLNERETTAEETDEPQIIRMPFVITKCKKHDGKLHEQLLEEDDAEEEFSICPHSESESSVKQGKIRTQRNPLNNGRKRGRPKTGVSVGEILDTVLRWRKLCKSSSIGIEG
jgi:hypothetical protein